jgi:hypothetical protein
MNEPLQRRAGRNIGVSPMSGALAAYQQHVAAPFVTLGNNDTVLWQAVEGCVRAPGGSKPKFPGLLFTDDLALGDVELDLIFIDSEGDEFIIGEGFLGSGDGVGLLVITGENKASKGKAGLNPLGLCPGEKIIARVTSGTPAGKVKAVPYTKDFKRKGAGKGGLSDGGVRCLRGEVTTSGVDFGPPPGITWESMDGPGNLFGGGGIALMITNADKDDVAEINVTIIGPDGTEYPFNENITGPIPVFPESFLDVSMFFLVAGPFDAEELRMYGQYPSKIRVSLDNGGVKGRVGALLLVGENDVPGDLAQEASS